MSERAEVPENHAAGRSAIRASQNLIAGLALIAIAAIALWASADLGEGRFYAVGPGLLPRAVATLIGLIGLALTAGSLIRKGDALGRWGLRGPLFLFLSVAAFALSIRTVGLALAGPVAVLVSGAASPETRPKELIVFALVVTALSLPNLGLAFIGCLVGTLIGVLPGIGPIATITMLLPITFNFDPVGALIMLAGIYYGAQYGGSTTAILVNIPGEVTAIVTTLDG